jgi:hypothetical protein
MESLALKCVDRIPLGIIKNRNLCFPPDIDNRINNRLTVNNYIKENDIINTDSIDVDVLYEILVERGLTEFLTPYMKTDGDEYLESFIDDIINFLRNPGRAYSISGKGIDFTWDIKSSEEIYIYDLSIDNNPALYKSYDEFLRGFLDFLIYKGIRKIKDIEIKSTSHYSMRNITKDMTYMWDSLKKGSIIIYGKDNIAQVIGNYLYITESKITVYYNMKEGLKYLEYISKGIYTIC